MWKTASTTKSSIYSIDFLSLTTFFAFVFRCNYRTKWRNNYSTFSIWMIRLDWCLSRKIASTLVDLKINNEIEFWTLLNFCCKKFVPMFFFSLGNARIENVCRQLLLVLMGLCLAFKARPTCVRTYIDSPRYIGRPACWRRLGSDGRTLRLSGYENIEKWTPFDLFLLNTAVDPWKEAVETYEKFDAI